MGTQEYIHYSHPHDSYARLDYLYCTPIILANSYDASIHICSWSDHRIASFTTSLNDLANTPYSWRPNESLLLDPISQQIIAPKNRRIF